MTSHEDLGRAPPPAVSPIRRTGSWLRNTIIGTLDFVCGFGIIAFTLAGAVLGHQIGANLGYYARGPYGYSQPIADYAGIGVLLGLAAGWILASITFGVICLLLDIRDRLKP